MYSIEIFYDYLGKLAWAKGLSPLSPYKTIYYRKAEDQYY